MIYNSDFTNIVKRKFREMSITNPPAIDPKALGMANNILIKYQRDIHTSAMICMGVIADEFINYCNNNNICNNYYEVDRILDTSVMPALNAVKDNPYGIYQALIRLLFLEDLKKGNISLEIGEFCEKCDDIAIEYFNWYRDNAIKAGVFRNI